MTDKRDVMLDIETLDTAPTALVLSVAVVPFNCSLGTGPVFGEAFFRVPDIIEQLRIGRTVSISTQKFWQAQTAAASDHWAGPNIPRCSVRDMLVELREFVADAPRIWANGIVFDIGIMESLFAQQPNLPVPWKYNATRDARTFYDTNPRQRTVPDSDTYGDLIAHHPIGDCKSQIIRMWEHGWSQ